MDSDNIAGSTGRQGSGRSINSGSAGAVQFDTHQPINTSRDRETFWSTLFEGKSDGSGIEYLHISGFELHAPVHVDSLASIGVRGGVEYCEQRLDVDIEPERAVRRGA